ncbi:MAG: serine hydrolase [Bacillota bacterium]
MVKQSSSKQRVFPLPILLFIIILTLGNSAAVAQTPPDILGGSAILADGKSGRILFEKNPDAVFPPASMTKMMTEYLILEAIKSGKISWDQKISISDYAYTISQNRKLSNVPLRKDDRYSVRELYESMIIYSANGSTIALAELVGGTETNFLKMMSAKAKQMGLKNYKFVNCTGLNNRDLKDFRPRGTGPEEENLMSARSTAVLAYRLIHDFPDVLKTSSIPTKVFREGTTDRIKMENWNWMLPELVYGYPGCDGIKTGSTDLGGYSFTATARRKGIRLISVVMKTGSYGERFGQTKKLLDYGFENYSEKQVLPSGYKTTLPVANGKQKSVVVVTKKPLVVLAKKNEQRLFTPAYRLNPALSKGDALLAPLAKGQTVGFLTTNYKGTPNYGYLTEQGKEKVEISTTSAVKRASWLALLFRRIFGFFGRIF